MNRPLYFGFGFGLSYHQSFTGRLAESRFDLTNKSHWNNTHARMLIMCARGRKCRATMRWKHENVCSHQNGIIVFLSEMENEHRIGDAVLLCACVRVWCNGGYWFVRLLQAQYKIVRRMMSAYGHEWFHWRPLLMPSKYGRIWKVNKTGNWYGIRQRVYLWVVLKIRIRLASEPTWLFDFQL